MAISILPPMKPIPEGATLEDRERLFKEYRIELARLNPHMYNPDGSMKTTLQWLKGMFK